MLLFRVGSDDARVRRRTDKTFTGRIAAPARQRARWRARVIKCRNERVWRVSRTSVRRALAMLSSAGRARTWFALSSAGVRAAGEHYKG